MQLSFDTEDDIKVLFRFHIVAQIRSDDLTDLGVVVRANVDRGLLLLRGLKVEGLVFIVGVLNEVRHEALALQAHLSSAHDQAGFSSFHR